MMAAAPGSRAGRGRAAADGKPQVATVTEVPGLLAFLLGRIEEEEAEAHDQLERGPDWLARAASFGCHPERVVAGLEARRLLVKRAVWVATDQPPGYPPEARDLAVEVLRLAALPYAGHPDYRPAWRE